MEEYRRIFKATWPTATIYAGLGILVFLLWGKTILWLFAKATVKVLGLAVVGLGLLLGFFKKPVQSAKS